MLRVLVSLVLLTSALVAVAAAAEEAETVVVDSEEGLVKGIRPTLSVDYGLTTPQFNGADFDFETIGLLEFKLGYTSLDRGHAGVVSMLDSYLFASFANSGLGSSGDAQAVGSEFNRFGGGNRVGYGYQGKSVGLDLYNQNSLNWTEFSAEDYDTVNPEAQAIFDRYGSQHRFGHLMEAGVKFRVTPSLALTAGAEGAIVYPRYVFWPWFGSTAIYTVLQSAVEYFAEDIMESTPGAGPVLYFLLKTGVSLGYYLASQSDMNWPFDRETPVTMESFKIGASFAF